MIVLWRYLSLNILIENMQPVDTVRGDLSALNSVYNMEALVAALLISSYISPFMAMPDIIERYGETVLVTIYALSILITLCMSLVNLVWIILALFYLSTCDKSHRHAEIKDFPVFGVPLVICGASIIFCLITAVTFVGITMPMWYYTFALSIVIPGTVVGIALSIYTLFWRVEKFRHGNQNERVDSNILSIQDMTTEHLASILIKELPAVLASLQNKQQVVVSPNVGDIRKVVQ